MSKALLLEISGLLLLLVAGTVIIANMNLDMKLERMFYSQETGWEAGDAQPWKFLYHYGNIPALLLSVGSLILLFMGFLSTKYIAWRKIVLFFVLAMLLGPGLIVNLGFKNYWGRNRPRHVVELGGEGKFMQPWETGIAGQGKSFPCGHATMGFYLFTPFFILRKAKRWFALLSLLLGLIMGILIGYARMKQGGHFASDVLWAGGMVYLVSLAVYRWLKLDRSLLYVPRTQHIQHKKLAIGIGIPVVLIAIAAFLLGSPYYKHKSVSIAPETLGRSLRIVIDDGDLILENGDTFKIEWEANGFGFPGSKVRNRTNQDAPETTVFEIYRKGFFTEYHNLVHADIPWESLDRVEILIENGDVELPELPENVVLIASDEDPTVSRMTKTLKITLNNGNLSEDGGN